MIEIWSLILPQDLCKYQLYNIFLWQDQGRMEVEPNVHSLSISENMAAVRSSIIPLLVLLNYIWCLKSEDLLVVSWAAAKCCVMDSSNC